MTVNAQVSLAIASTAAQASANGAESKTPTGAHFINNVQNIQITTFEVIQKGDIGTVDYVFVKNLDTVNFVQLTADGATGSKIFAKLKAGQSALIPVDPSASIGLRSDTAACDVQIVASEA